ncbi:hypothetical protein [Burkholderia sp. FL-7-2-10-S1-D7]|uniref:hypothetical protein n=1 Tax=Burkholderia sp. FL-7-2-10-S1-D7 TaxID=1637866 RepID=UPI0015CFBC79|nr:hypothetical protein [Burkholderia sp. FL-7-2-10-S1-D7]
MENNVDCDTYDQYFASNNAKCRAPPISRSGLELRPVLEQLVAAGSLDRVRRQRVKLPNYMLAGTEKHVMQRDGYLGIPAAPCTYVVMTGDLDAYMSGVRRRADLCIMVRR